MSPWPGQNVNDAAYEMYNSWRKSPGHWSAVNGPCRYYGYAMRLVATAFGTHVGYSRNS